jgi:hypothetical protein
MGHGRWYTLAWKQYQGPPWNDSGYAYFLQQFFLFGRYFPAHSDDIITISKLEIPVTLRFSLVTAEALMLRAMNFLVWFMCLVKNVLDSNTTRRLVP